MLCQLISKLASMMFWELKVWWVSHHRIFFYRTAAGRWLSSMRIPAKFLLPYFVPLSSQSSTI